MGIFFFGTPSTADASCHNVVICYYFYIRVLRQPLAAAKTLQKTELQRAILRGLQGMEIIHTRGVYLTQDTSRMGTTRQEVAN